MRNSLSAFRIAKKMQNIDTFRQFCKDVAHGQTPQHTRCTAATPKDVLELLDCATKATKWLAWYGIAAKSGGNGSITDYGFWYRAGAHTFTVLPPSKAKAKRPQAVTQTSRDAYHTIDFTTQRDKIAEIIRQYSEGITRKEIEVLHRFGCNVVAGRVKELLEMSEAKPFFLCGKPFRLQVVGTRLSKCEGASNVPNEALRWVEVGQKTELF